MATYIEKEKLIDEIRSKDFFSEQVKMLSSYIISSQPEADVVPVVRCLNCRFYDSFYKECGMCRKSDCWTTINEYCSKGERREAIKVKPRRIPWEAD